MNDCVIEVWHAELFVILSAKSFIFGSGRVQTICESEYEMRYANDKMRPQINLSIIQMRRETSFVFVRAWLKSRKSRDPINILSSSAVKSEPIPISMFIGRSVSSAFSAVLLHYRLPLIKQSVVFFMYRSEFHLRLLYWSELIHNTRIQNEYIYIYRLHIKICIHW